VIAFSTSESRPEMASILLQSMSLGLVERGVRLGTATMKSMWFGYAVCVLLLLACSSCTLNAKSGSRMKGITRDEAVRMIQGYFKSHGVDSPGLNENNLGGAAVGEYQIYFEYQPAKQALKCSALVYKFRDEPKPGVIEAFKAEEKAQTADTGGGTLEYDPANKGLYLSRTYTDSVSDGEFARDLKQLMKASEVYGDQVLDRVASKVFQN